MKVLSPKLIEWFGNPTHWCPACKGGHPFVIKRPNIRARGPVWTFNGDYDEPTFSPSMRIFYTEKKLYREVTLCHYFLTNGIIKFCDDSPHALSGQMVELPNFPEDQFQYYEEGASWGQPTTSPPMLRVVK